MAGFGYIPREGRIKDFVCHLVGNPNFLRRLQAPILMRMLDIELGHAALDLGCGSGWLAREMARRCRLVAGVDLRIDPASLRGLPPNCALFPCDGALLPFKSGSFDRVLLSSVLQMVPDDRALLGEVRRVLAPGGRAVLSVPVGYLYLDWLCESSGRLQAFFVRRLRFPATREELRERLGAGFGVRGKGYYAPDDLSALVRGAGFRVVGTRYAPGKAASALFETWLAFALALGLNLASMLPFIFYPLFALRGGSASPAAGDELVMGIVPE
jgi:SAM-dependent methyltransferase